jgi:hypothetical protein
MKSLVQEETDAVHNPGGNQNEGVTAGRTGFKGYDPME